MEKYGWENLLAIELPPGVAWPREDMEGPLFIRDFYHRAWTEQLRSLKPNPSKLSGSVPSRFVVLGTPGIGKTAFTMYCFLRALVDKRPVRFRMSMKDASSSDFSHDVHVSGAGVVSGQRPSTSVKSYVFIHDSNRPDDVRIGEADGCLLVTSPDERVWKEWHKQRKAQSFYFPVHTRDELRTLAWLTGSDLELVDEGMANFGGIPRFVLDEVAAGDRLERMQKAVNELDQGVLQPIEAGHTQLISDPTHEIFSEEVDRATLKQTGQLLIPHNLVPSIMKHILLRRKVDADGLIRVLEKVPGACRYAGELLEPQVLRLLEGRSFSLRQLTPDIVAPSAGAGAAGAIPPLTSLRFATPLRQVQDGNFRELVARCVSARSDTAAVTLCAVSTNKSEAAVDFVLSNGVLCNVTLQRSHDILVEGSKGAGLRALLGACPALIQSHNGAAYVNFVWWQLVSRAHEQLRGPLVFGAAREQEGDDARADVIMVKGQAVHVRQFVAPIMMSEEALRALLLERTESVPDGSLLRTTSHSAHATSAGARASTGATASDDVTA
ncbi:MAG: hypothetical protein EOO65_02840 [Methanosarcinales archaeon]|nr:MAG: hypothetical protein EOO65_02840 [Methanosarcinales archaeon]